MKNKKLKRGPRPKPESEIKVPIKIWVKKKYVKDATIKIIKIENEYENID
jgi:hypothetical protein